MKQIHQSFVNKFCRINLFLDITTMKHSYPLDAHGDMTFFLTDDRGLNGEKPDVVEAIPTLFNHNGLNIDLEYPSYNWKIPAKLSGDCCVIRIR